MNVANIIEQKRDGEALRESEIRDLVLSFSKGKVPDYQMSAFAMAVYFQGMSLDETVVLTRAMIDSGKRFEWPAGTPKVDKHSTGGIGDKVSIALAPLVACCGVDVPMISGRGLGATGGTLDKLEAIPGYRCDLSMDEFRSVVNWNGCSISGATADLAPADKKLYALRDVTGTVPSIPLITASILSKKVAEGISALALDVKWGTGAFMKTLDRARALAQSLVAVGNQMGLNTSALITDMNQPLGNMIGNSVEIAEAIELLNGEGPADLRTLTLRLGSELLVLAKVESNLESATTRLEQAISNGAAMEKFQEMVRAHGGDLSRLPAPATEHPISASESGYVSRINANRLGLVVIEMGGGRKQMGDPIDPRVGMDFRVKLGDKIESGETIATIFCDAPVWKYAAGLVEASIGIAAEPVQTSPLVVEKL